MFLFMSMGWNDVSELRPPTALLFIPQMYKHGNQWWNDIEELWEPPVKVPLCTPPSPTWIDVSANLGLRGEKPVTNHVSHGTALVEC
jgi:hypothetical protein